MTPQPEKNEQSGHMALAPQHERGASNLEVFYNPLQTGWRNAGAEYSAVRELWRRIWEWKILIAGITLLGLAGGVAIGLLQQPQYRAKTVVELVGINDNYLNLKDVQPTASAATYAADSYLQSQVRFIESDAMGLRVAKALHLSSSGHAKRVTGWCEVGSRLGFASCLGRSADEELIRLAMVGLQVRGSLESRLIEISYEAPNPERAALLANLFANEYVAEELENRKRAALESAAWLEKQLAKVREKVMASEDSIQRYAKSSGLLYFSNRENVIEENLRKLQLELVSAQADRMAKQSRYEVASATSLSAIPAEAAPKIGALQDSIVELRRQYVAAQSKFTVEHPKVQQLRDQLDEMEKALQKEQVTAVTRMKSDYESAQRREDLLKGMYKEHIHGLTAQTESAETYDLLKHELATSQQLYDGLLQKLRETEIAAALKTSNSRILDFARPPSVPYSPNPKLNGAIGGMGALGLGLMLALGLSSRAQKLKEPGDSSRVISVRELGAIPSAPAVRQHGKAFDLRGEQRVELATWYGKSSLLAESYRATITSILLLTPGTIPVLVVTSLQQREGKTTTATNLALALAQLKKRVLLVDADLRRPRVHQIFELENRHGLSDLLDNPQRAADELIRPTLVSGLDILPSGSADRESLPVIEQLSAKRLFHKLRSGYDIVLVDTPPAPFAETRVLSNVATGVLLVVRARQTSAEQLSICYNHMLRDNVAVLGTILNDWQPKSDGNPYPYSYYGQ